MQKCQNLQPSHNTLLKNPLTWDATVG